MPYAGSTWLNKVPIYSEIGSGCIIIPGRWRWPPRRDRDMGVLLVTQSEHPVPTEVNCLQQKFDIHRKVTLLLRNKAERFSLPSVDHPYRHAPGKVLGNPPRREGIVGKAYHISKNLEHV